MYYCRVKKIDFHIHTVPVAGKDAYFKFDLDKLREFVDELSMDAVAVTNHNLFDLEQFKEIEKVLENTTVFPGIEIDFENGHLLLIGEKDNLEDFYEKCELVRVEVESGNKITVTKLKGVFSDLGKYLLIPHYDKKPKVSQTALDSLEDCIFAGEVSSPKKFNRTIKEKDSLTPVVFSDIRIGEDLDLGKHEGRHTFIKTNSNPLSIDILNATLRDKNKVFLSNTGKHGVFQVFRDGQELCNGLNIVLGGRSSGKTHLLDRLKETFDIEEKSVKYIKQFDLVKEDEEEFNKIVEKERSAVREAYLQEFQEIVEDITAIDRRANTYKLGKYIESLVEFASSEKLHDEFSAAALFTETPFQIRENPDLVALIKAIKLLQKDSVYKVTITKYLSSESLEDLLTDLESQYEEEATSRLKRQWVNELVKNIGQKLKHKTASPNIEYNEIDFYSLKMEEESLKRFNAIANSLKNETVIDENTSFEKFTIQAIAGPYSGAGELHEESRRQISFAPAFKKYDSPIDFLEELKCISGLEKTELYKYFCKVTYQVLNKYGKRVSGGERAEFNLLKALEDARQYEMLLVDEPESSFDNLFLKDNVNREIKEISKELPVVVVTHNNTVGMLMQPDYILYAQREIVGGRDEYKIFSGSPGDKEFKTADGTHQIDSYDTLMDALEAGEEAYGIRKGLYDTFKK